METLVILSFGFEMAFGHGGELYGEACDLNTGYLGRRFYPSKSTEVETAALCSRSYEVHHGLQTP